MTTVDIEQDELREKVVEVARRHKASWIELGQYLYTIQKNKMYKHWGFIEFDGYVAKELGVKPLTALKMVRSYMFLEREVPKVIESQSSGNESPKKIPSFEAVDVLRLAQKNKSLTSEELDQIRKDVLETGREPKEIRAQVRRLISEHEVKDPAEVRKTRRNQAIKRLITVLANTKKELAAGNLLPAYILKQIAELEQKLEDQIES